MEKKKVVDEIKGVLKGRKKKADVATSITMEDVERAIKNHWPKHDDVSVGEQLDLITKRIDRIVAAIHNSKSVKGM